MYKFQSKAIHFFIHLSTFLKQLSIFRTMKLAAIFLVTVILVIVTNSATAQRGRFVEAIDRARNLAAKVPRETIANRLRGVVDKIKARTTRTTRVRPTRRTTTASTVSTASTAPASNCEQRICTLEYKPVCGTDGVTYGNQCAFEYERDCNQKTLAIAFEGEC